MASTRRTLIVSLLLFGMLATMTWLATQLVVTLREQQRMSQDLAELDDVKYGLLDPNAWVEHLSGILEKKINEFELEPDNRAAIKLSMNRMLDTLITEVDRFMRRQNLQQQGSWWKRTSGKFKQSFQDIFINIQDIKTAIPEYADQILTELNKPGAREELNRFLKKMITDLSSSSFAPVDYTAIEAIQQRYACQEWKFCRGMLEARLGQQREQAMQLALALFGLTLALFILIRLESPQPPPSRFLALTCAATILMACGVLTPMIEVEARITELRFVLMQEPVVFADQVLYFQSKSVLDMVHILTATGALDMIVVGGLIMLFSVLFPLAKLAASLVYLYGREALRNNALIRFFALKSGKWSMADVMVVAIFMAYIGFNGIIASQLSGFAEASASVDVLTTNGTELEIGFFMFLAFCLSGLLTSSWMESAMQRSPSELAEVDALPLSETA